MNPRNPSVAKARASLRSPVPWGSVAMLGMVATVELAVARHDLDVSTVWAQDWRFAGRAARTESSRCAILCFGDSLIKHGIYPKVVEAELGGNRRVYNLAMHSGKAPGTYFQLRAALDSGARPEAAIVDFDALHLTMGPRSHLRQWPELLAPRDCIDLALTARDATLAGELLSAELLPSLKARNEIREYLYDIYKRKLHWNRYSLLIHRRNWEANRGAQVLGPPDRKMEEETRRKLLPENSFEPANSPWVPDPVNDRYVHRFVKLAGRRGIAVFWLIPPCREEVQRRRDRGRAEKDYLAYVQRIARENPNVVVLDARRSGFPDSVFHDLTHLFGQGAVALSAGTADAVRARLSNPPKEHDRWAYLPPYRPIRTMVPVEDLEDSRKVVRGEHGRRKR